MIGVDLVKIPRIESIINRFGEKFINRFFHKDEIKAAVGFSQKRRISHFAKRFAAKEAFLEARGHGLGLRFADLCVANDKYGRPKIFFQGDEMKCAKISLSDDGDYAIAFVILDQC